MNDCWPTKQVESLISTGDLWKPKALGKSPSDVGAINRGIYVYYAVMEGMLKNRTNIYAGFRTIGYCPMKTMDTAGSRFLRLVILIQ